MNAMQLAIQTLALLVGVGVGFGPAVTKVVDVLRKLDPRNRAPKVVWNVAALLVGEFVVFSADAAGILPQTFHGPTWLGLGIVGLVAGGAGSGWHEVFDNLSSGAKAKRAAAGLPPG